MEHIVMTDDKPSVLVVEDEKDLRVTVAEVLRMEGYRVSEASHGAEAIEKLDAEPLPDLILLDVMMPVMDGYDFRRRQMEHPEWSEIPIILYTSSKDAEADEFDAVDVLRKPVGIQQLVEVVDRHLSGPGAEP